MKNNALGKGGMPPRPRAPKGTMRRILVFLVKSYPVLLPLTALSILFTAVVSAMPAIFMRRVFELIEQYQATGDLATAFPKILSDVLILGSMYAVSTVSVTLYNQLMVYIDGNLKFTYVIEYAGSGCFGISAATGSCRNLHAVRNINVIEMLNQLCQS